LGRDVGCGLAARAGRWSGRIGGGLGAARVPEDRMNKYSVEVHGTTRNSNRVNWKKSERLRGMIVQDKTNLIKIKRWRTADSNLQVRDRGSHATVREALIVLGKEVDRGDRGPRDE